MSAEEMDAWELDLEEIQDDPEFALKGIEHRDKGHHKKKMG